MTFFDRFMSDRATEFGSENIVRGEVFEVLNSEGEIYSIDTGDPGCPFQGPAWRNVLSSASDHDYYIPVEASYRKRDREENFVGYTVNFGYGVEGFLPRSRSGYYYPEERDATSKRLLVRVIQFHPCGVKQGNVVVEAAQLHGKDGVKMNVSQGSSLWGLSVDILMERHILLELPSGKFGIAPVEEALRLTGMRYLEALTGRNYRVIVGKICHHMALSRTVHSVSLREVQSDD